MKVVILCGGQGTRIRDVADNIPKPMIPVGPAPILWHVMKTYASWGHTEFILCLGYKSHTIKEFFLNYEAFTNDFTLTLGRSKGIEYHGDHDESGWKITLAETGLDSLTGSRVKRIAPYLGDDEEFMLTYADGVADVNLDALVAHHRSHGKLLTVTGVRPPGRFGELGMDHEGKVREFNEKPQTSEGWISGGYFVCNRRVLDFIGDDNVMFEQDPMRRIVESGELMVHKHDGFWQCMDTYRDYALLNDLWAAGKAPWRRW
ncbi:MAG: glucose-1-phosphate cytidylyltransferase [Rhizobiales bacterium]|nr:glucose-1-phosphate cytidylyltransferase [Hyphomicrobiales bacterium]